MLIEFTVGNYLSFRKTNTFSMVGSNSTKEHEETNTFTDPGNRLKFLKVSEIYGANGSGKSNLISSLSFMKRFILNSFRDALIEENERKIQIDKFLLNAENEDEPSLFEIVFIYQGKRYRYGFEIDEKKIHSEWLFFVNTTKEIQLFIRNGQEISYNLRSFKEAKGLREKTRENVLFLSVAAQFDGKKSNNILEWFKKLKIISGLDDRSYKDYTTNKIDQDEKFKSWIGTFVKFLEIEEISTEKGALPSSNANNLPENLIALHILKEARTANKISTWHNKFDNSNKIIDKIPFDFDTQESEGSKKLISLLGPLYDVLQNGLILVADELDSRFHPLLTIKIIEFFHTHNPQNAQLIFASHDTNLLKKELFRRDQIWFTEKNEYGETDLYSLVEYRNFHVRKDASFDKNYLAGKYGAIPFFGDIDNILDLIYGKKKE
ncbi:AAA family ATPase [Desulfonema magnum]|uniref:AAA ATPase-like domain-containing protein n=1 Tax=Desulfonema magnum TaxID=45655 RepID=A0A975GLH8_9BACT|nr:ATP-binding protein [Desulfonema magnum]QTA85782.1 AAA ATPase-like domain-containing protein [Desulfonema magnum]